MARSKNIKFDTTITVGDTEIEVEVEGSWTAGHPGTMYARNGDPGDPPEGAEFEVDCITDSEGKEYEYDSLGDCDKDAIDAKGLTQGEDAEDDEEPDFIEDDDDV